MSEPRKRTVLKAVMWIAIVIGVIVIVFGLKPAETEEMANQKSAIANKLYEYEKATDESAQDDELAESSVNKERLRQRFLKTEPTIVDTTHLDTEINKIISQNPDIVFGVSIKDLSSEISYNYGNQNAMTAASVTKVLTAVYYLSQVESGNRSLETVMANGQTAQYNLEQMIVVSDNDSWHVLNDNLGYLQLQDYAHSIGLTSYSYSGNTISSPNTALLFGDLYQRKLINEVNTQLLLSYMERANYRDLIIPAVPPTDTTYHKAGEYLVNLNDAAIITNGTQTIVLSIYTESTSSYSKSRVAGLMQQMTTPTISTFHLN